MERTNGIAMEIDLDNCASDNNTITEQAQQSNGQSEKINLLELPREILEDILIHLEDRDLLTASHVCKLFASVCYEFNGEDQLQKSFDKVMLAKYGACMRWISVIGNDEEILDLIEQNCHNLERVELLNVSKMIHLKDLKVIVLVGVDNLSREKFAECVSRNQQLERLHLLDNDISLLDLLDGQLNSLKTFKYRRFVEFTTNLPQIRLNSLESLTVHPHENETCVRLLRALVCKQLKELELKLYSGLNDNNEIVNVICKFKTLALLRMPQFSITATELEKLAAHLPCLTELCVRTDEKQSNAILNNVSAVLSVCPKLTKLSLNLNDESSFGQFAADVKKSINEFHGRFAETSTEIAIVNSENMVFTSKDFAFVDDDDTLKLHWMANWNDESVLKAMDHLPCCVSDMNFINHCAEHTVDICVFLKDLEELNCLDIKSDGPINFKANVSRHHNFFPDLTALKLHLDEHNAIDFLGKLDNSFCERIEELWLDTKGYLCRDEELKHAQDMTNILTKFKNLKSLYVAPAFANFVTTHVLSVCKNLNDLRVLR